MPYFEVFKHIFQITLDSSIRQIAYVGCEWWFIWKRFARISTILSSSTTTTSTITPASLITVSVKQTRKKANA